MKSIAIAFFLILLVACDDEPSRSSQVDWKKLGLDGKTINELKIAGANLYAATTTGLFYLPESSADFQLIGFGGENVEVIELLANGELIVSVFDKTGAEPPALFRTADQGATWNEVASDFGGEIQEPIFDLEVHPGGENILFATGYAVVASSNDQGATWQPLYGDWGGFATGLSVVELNPHNNEIWAGGQGAIENGILLHTSDGAQWNSWSDLVENPTVVKEITFVNSADEELFVGFEGALLKTGDNGKNWRTLIHSEETRFFFGICMDPDDPERVYAGGWVKTPDPQELLLFISDDGGETWNERRFESEAYGGVLDMQIKKDGSDDIIFLGLDKGGVYQVTVRD